MKKYTLTFKNPALEEEYQVEQREVMISSFQYYFKILMLSNIMNVSYWLSMEEYFKALAIVIPMIIEYIVQKIIYQQRFRQYFRFFIYVMSIVFSLQQTVMHKYPIQLFIIHQIMIQLLSTQNFIENSILYLFFLAMRIYIIEDFTILEFCVLLNSAFYISNQYITCWNSRKMFLQKQTNELWKHGLEESKTSIMILKYFEHNRRFEQVFANHQMNNIISTQPDFVQNLYTLDNKQCIRTYLYNNFIKLQKIESFQINCHFKKLLFKITGTVYRINEFKFILQIEPLHSAITTNYKILYTELMNYIKNQNKVKQFKQLYKREIMKMTIAQLIQGTYIFQQFVLSDVQQIKQIFNPRLVIADQGFSINTDSKLLFLLGSLIKTRSKINTIEIHYLNKNEIQITMHLQVVIDIQSLTTTLNKIVRQIGKNWHYIRGSRVFVFNLMNRTYLNFR